MFEVSRKNRHLTFLSLHGVRYIFGKYRNAVHVILGRCECIMGTFQANHSIGEIEVMSIEGSNERFVSVGMNDCLLSQLLEWNHITLDSNFARCRKIIEFHFGSNCDLDYFGSMSKGELCLVELFFRSARINGVPDDVVDHRKLEFFFNMVKGGICGKRNDYVWRFTGGV